MQSKRVNAMEHPAYNTWSLKEKFSMPEVQWALGKLAAACALLFLISLVYLSVSVWIMLAIPVFHAQREALQEEQFKLKTGCLTSPSRMVVFDCNQSSFAVPVDAAFLNETIARTITQLTDTHPHMRPMLFEIMGCTDENGWCRNMLFNTIDALLHNRMLIIGLSWLSTTLMLCVGACTRGPVRYYSRLRDQLDQHSAEGVMFLGMSSTQKAAYLAALASPAPTKQVEEYQLWRPRPVHEVKAEEISSSSSTPELATTPPLPFSADEAEDETAFYDSPMDSEDGIRHRPLPRNRPGPKPLPRSAETNAASSRASALL